MNDLHRRRSSGLSCLWVLSFAVCVHTAFAATDNPSSVPELVTTTTSPSSSSTLTPEIQGDLLKFNILHEDWGDGDLPTFYKHVTCHVGWNELRCTTAADHQPPPRPAPPGVIPGFSLTGPIAIEATAGNRWPEWPLVGTSAAH